MAFLSKLLRADRLHVLRLVLANVRGGLWKLAVTIFCNVSAGKNLLCWAWPRFAFAQGRIIIGDEVHLGRVLLNVTPNAVL